MDNIRKEMEILRNNKKEMLELKTLREIKNAFDGLISRLNMAEGRIPELNDISIVISKKLKQRKQRLKEKNRTKYSRIVGQQQQQNVMFA